jgi:hypothetical protein
MNIAITMYVLKVNSAMSRILRKKMFTAAPLKGIKIRHIQGNINYIVVNCDSGLPVSISSPSLLTLYEPLIVPVIRIITPTKDTTSVTLSMPESFTF